VAGMVVGLQHAGVSSRGGGKERSMESEQCPRREGHLIKGLADGACLEAGAPG